jgi:putative salt-induced outer membrane protein YdiY
MSRNLLSVLLAGVFCASSPLPAAEKSDLVFLGNGDRITGEVKSLEQGKLRLKTDSAGTIYIEWAEIERLSSSQTLEVELQDGEKFFGVLEPDAEAGTLKIQTEDQRRVLEMPVIVRMTPIEESRWKRLDGSFDLGFGFTSSNKSSQVSLGSEVRYRTRKYQRNLGFSSTRIDQESGERTKRQSLDGGVQRFLANRRFVGGTLQFQENEELGLDLRSLVTVGMGRHAVQTNAMQLDLFGGIALNWEDFAGSDVVESTELVGGLQFAFFRFNDPETDFRVNLLVYPSLSQSGRVRVEFDTRLRRELVKDFFWTISVYDSYDSEPPIQGVETNDWGLNSSVGWSF